MPVWLESMLASANHGARVRQGKASQRPCIGERQPVPWRVTRRDSARLGGEKKNRPTTRVIVGRPIGRDAAVWAYPRKNAAATAATLSMAALQHTATGIVMIPPFVSRNRSTVFVVLRSTVQPIILTRPSVHRCGVPMLGTARPWLDDPEHSVFLNHAPFPSGVRGVFPHAA